MSQTKDEMPNFKIELDGNGMPVLPASGGKILNKGKTTPTNRADDDYASDEDILAAGAGEEIKTGEGIEQASRPKLLKSGQPKHRQTQTNTKNDVVTQAVTTPEDIEESSIRHLIESADKSEQSISIEIKLNAIEKDLFKILSKSYKDKSELILNLIVESNMHIIQTSIKNSIGKHYENQSEEND